MKHFRRVILFFLLFIVFFAAYGDVFWSGQFLWDDRPLILVNPSLAEGASLRAIFGRELYPGTGTNYYRPLLAASFFLDKSCYGLNPRGFHATNMMLHAVAGWLLFALLLKLTARFFLSFAASAIFLLHPIQAQAVSYISGRSDPLCAIFILAMLLCYLKYLRENKGLYFLVSQAFFLLALLTKEMAFAAPLAVGALDIFFGPVAGRKKRLASFFLFAAAYAVLRAGAMNFSAGKAFLAKEGFGFSDIGLTRRAALFLKTLVLYIGAFFAPYGLHMERLTAFEKIRACDIFGMLIFLATTAGAFFRGAREKAVRTSLSFFIAWFFIWLLPQSAFVFPAIMAEHFLYLPGVLFCLLAALGLDGARPEPLKYFALGLLALLLAGFAFRHNSAWKDEISFFERTCDLAPRSVRARDNLGSLYLERGRLEEAAEQFLRIIDPEGEGVGLDFDSFCARALKKSGDFGTSEHKKARAAAFHNLGVIYEKRQDAGKAASAYRAALGLNPLLNEARNNLGFILERAGDTAQAREHYRRAVELDPEFLAGYNNLARSYAQEGRLAEALALWRGALAIDPGYVLARENIHIAEEILRGSTDKRK